MPHFPTSTVTISREDGKLVIARKPVLPTRRQKFFGCFWPILIVVCLGVFCLVMSFNHIYRTDGKEEAYGFLIVVAVATTAILVAITTLVMRDKLRRQSVVLPPDYEDEILTFGTDKFVIQYQGMISWFSYRLDDRPVLRRCPYSSSQKHVDFVIPCSPLGDYVPSDFHLGYYVMSYIELTDAKRILVAFKEHLEAIRVT
jgi:hypothetical protein